MHHTLNLIDYLFLGKFPRKKISKMNEQKMKNAHIYINVKIDKKPFNVLLFPFWRHGSCVSPKTVPQEVKDNPSKKDGQMGD